MPRSVRSLFSQLAISETYICRRCLQARGIRSTAALSSGHSRWSTIKHDKGKNDAVKNKQRSEFSREIALASKLFGPNPADNPRLQSAITTAKRSGFPKASIEAAIARGQGKSVSGTALEPLTIEGIIPPSVAVVIDCQTDNKLRTLADIKQIFKDHDGSVTPTSYLFARKGRVTFQQKEGVGVDEVLEEALEVGALDVQEDIEGRVVVFSEPSETNAVGNKLAEVLGMDIEGSEIIWDANEDTKVGLENEDAVYKLSEFVEDLQDVFGFQGIYMNAGRGTLPEGSWNDLQTRIAAAG